MLVAGAVVALGGARSDTSGGKSAAGLPRLNPPKKPLRALQVLTFECDDWEAVDRRLAEFKEAGVQAVIVRVFHNPGDGYYRFVEPRYKAGVYFKTDHAPVVADALGPLCKLAHARGLGVIAWMTSRHANYGREDDTALRCMAWDFASRGLEKRRGYCPLLPAAQDRVAAIFDDLARYPIDGVLLQDDLILKHTEGMNPAARALYEKATGRSAEPDDLFEKVREEGGRYIVGEYTEDFDRYRAWQNRALLAFAERLRRTVQARRPGRPVGMNLYYETLTAPDNAMDWYAQSMETTMKSELDFYAIMAYHRQMESELRLGREAVFGLLERSLADVLEKVDDPRRVWMKVQSVDWDTGARLPSAEIGGLLSRIERLGPVGLVVTPAKRSLDLVSLKESFTTER